jgi:hypothetical protein
MSATSTRMHSFTRMHSNFRIDDRLLPIKAYRANECCWLTRKPVNPATGAVLEGFDLNQPRIGRSIRKWIEMEAAMQIAITIGQERPPPRPSAARIKMIGRWKRYRA